MARERQGLAPNLLNEPHNLYLPAKVGFSAAVPIFDVCKFAAQRWG